MPRHRITAVILLGCLLGSPLGTRCALGQDSSPSADAQQIRQQIQALHWQSGPKTVAIADNSTLQLPEGYTFLDKADTSKFEELTQNLANGNEVLVSPETHDWVAFIEFSDEGLVKEDEKIDANALLATLRHNNDAANEDRRRRGWDTLQIAGWALPPQYDSTTKRLEWAMTLEGGGTRNVNFATKILGRRGFTTVVVACSVEEQAAAITQLNKLLTGYRFNDGERYADYRKGDKVATYGLGALVLGGAAVAASKAGLLKPVLAVLVAGWKLIVAGVVAALAFLRSLFARKKPPQTPI